MPTATSTLGMTDAGDGGPNPLSATRPHPSTRQIPQVVVGRCAYAPPAKSATVPSSVGWSFEPQLPTQIRDRPLEGVPQVGFRRRVRRIGEHRMTVRVPGGDL